MYPVYVTFKYGKDRAMAYGNWTGEVAEKREAVVHKALKTAFTAPDHKMIEILKIEWR